MGSHDATATNYHSVDDLNWLGNQILMHATQTVQQHLSDDWDTWNNIDSKYNILPTWAGKEAEVETLGNPSDSQVRGYMGSVYGDIISLFSSYGHADPNNCMPMADTMWDVATALNPNLKTKITVDPTTGTVSQGPADNQLTPKVWIHDRLGKLYDHLAGWQGTAGDAFRTDFVHFIDVQGGPVDYQAALAMSLAMALNAHQSIRMAANQDVWKIGFNTLNALDKLYATTSPLNNIQPIFSVLLACAAVATAGEGVPIALATCGLVNTLVTALKGGGTAKAKIGGGTVPAVLDSMKNAINQVSYGINHEEKNLADGLNQLLATVYQDSNNDGGNISHVDIPPPTEVSNQKGFVPT